MNPSLENHPGWQWCTAEGAELHTLLLGLRSSFQEKLQWLEEAEDLTIAMATQRGRLRDLKEKDDAAPKSDLQILPEI